MNFVTDIIQNVHGSSEPQSKINATSETKERPTSEFDALAMMSAADLLSRLTPGCAPDVFARLRIEGVRTAAELLRLDKADLQALGLNMVERSRVANFSTVDFQSGSIPVGVARSTSLGMPVERYVSESNLFKGRSASWSADGADGSAQQRLDSVEMMADFWFDMIVSAQSHKKNSVMTLEESVQGSDVRENVLENLFDLTPERVKEVYDGIDRDADGCISILELGRGLTKYKLPEFGQAELAQILKLVSGKSNGLLRLPEFEAVLSRLKLAHVLSADYSAEALRSTVNGPNRLTVVDYTISSATTKEFTTDSQLRSYFFGHRIPSLPSEPVPVRWVHMPGLDRILLLALTVKYSLHPLSVEDVIEQTPTKIERNGSNYFVAIEQIYLTSAPDGTKPVRVQGRHLGVFCAGPPYSDTVISVLQPDGSLEADWPGGVGSPSVGGDKWMDKVRQRLNSPLSRLRERRADFLMYQMIDLSTDELVSVNHAFMKRLSHLEVELRKHRDEVLPEWDSEVLNARLQLAVVRRRASGLQRVLRQLLNDRNPTAGMSGYLQDVMDHLNEALDDVGQLSYKCETMLDMHERAVERAQQHLQQNMSDRLNRTLFVLTAATTLFAPVQFMAGVYGMNFQSEEGGTTMPELLWPHGYYYFWGFVATYLLFSILFAVWLFRRLHRRRS